GIAFSGATLHPILAAGARMAIAATLGAALLAVWRIRLPLGRAAMRSYGWSLAGIWAALSLSYMAAMTVPSGLISVLYGLSPMVCAVLAQWLTDEPPLPVYRWMACLLALAGLTVLFMDDVVIRRSMVPGLLMLLLAVLLFSLSAVMVK